MRNVYHRAYVWQPRPLAAALSTTRVPTRALPSRLSLPTKEGEWRTQPRLLSLSWIG
jgi:hypothetical protein